MKRRIVFAFAAVALMLEGCSQPVTLSLMNNSGGRIEILHFSVNGDRTETLNGAPWYSPFRRNPTLAQGYKRQIGWPADIIMEIASGACRMWFSVPSTVGTEHGGPETLQIDPDLQLYFVGSYADRPVDVSEGMQPPGYPLAPTEHSGCEGRL